MRTHSLSLSLSPLCSALLRFGTLWDPVGTCWERAGNGLVAFPYINIE